MATVAKRDFAEKLQACREQAGFKDKTEFAAAIGMSKGTVSRAENKNDDYVPKPDTFQKMLVALGPDPGSEMLQALQQAWQKARNEDGETLSETSDPYVKLVSDALNEWPPISPERAALASEFETIARNWQSYRLAIEHQERGWHSLARQALDELVKEIDGQPRLKMRVLLKLAYARRYLGEAERALNEQLIEALKLAEEHSGLEPEIHANILLAMGNFLRRFGRLDEAKNRFKESETVFSKIPNPKVQKHGFAVTERKIAGTLLYQGRAKEAEQHARTSIHLFTSLGDRVGERKGQQHLAWALALLGQYEKAKSIHESIINQIETTPTSLVEKAKSLRYFADLVRMCRDTKEAINWYMRALHFLEERTHSETLAPVEESLTRGPILLGLGQTYRMIDALDRAETYLRQGERVTVNDPYFHARILNELGRLAVEEGTFLTAIRRYDSAKEEFEIRGNNY